MEQISGLNGKAEKVCLGVTNQKSLGDIYLSLIRKGIAKTINSPDNTANSVTRGVTNLINKNTNMKIKTHLLLNEHNHNQSDLITYFNLI